MKIRTQFIINIVILGAILLFVSVAVMVTSQRIENTHRQQELAAQIEREAYELGYLADDYLLHRESQQASRWEAKFVSFSDHLLNLQVYTPPQQALRDNLKANQQRLKAVFEEVQAKIEAAPQTQVSGFDEKFMQVSWGRLEVQNQGMIFDASRLEGLLNEQEHRLEGLARLLSFVLIGMLGVFLLVNYGLTFRRTLQGITTLQAGTRIVGLGNLDYAIDVKSDDELGELSHAFNRMTRQLKTITASRAELEKEIAERKQAEEAQQLERARWQGIVEGIADEVWTCDAQGRIGLLNLEAVTVMGLDIFKDKSVEEVYQDVDIFYPDGQPRLPEQAPLLRSLDGEILRGEEIMRHRQTGIARYRQFSSAPTRDANGTITGAVAIVRDVTDQKLAEEGLRRYELLSNHSRDIILFMRRADGQILEANSAAMQAYGYSREEILGLSIRDLRAPHTMGLTAEQMAEADAGGILFETVHLRKNGNTFPVEVSSRGATIGNVRTLVSVVRDITERKQAEEKLRRSEETLRAVLDQMPSGVTVRDAHTGTLILSNARSREIMGALVDSTNQFTQYRGFHPDGRLYQIEDWPLFRSMDTGEVVRAEEVTYERKDGVRITLSINSAPVRDLQGQIVMGVGVFDDITERKQAETALRESEKSLQRAQQVAHVGSWSWYIPENRLSWSDEMYRIFGIDKETFSGYLPDVIAQAIHPDDRAAVEHSNLSVIQNNKPIPLEYRIIWPDQTVRYVWAEAGDLLTDQYGKPVLLTGIVQDITERKRAEEALRESEQRLKLAQEIAHLGSWELDLVNNQLTWSDEVYRIFGLQPQEFDATYEAFLELVHPGDRAAVDDAYSSSIREGRDSYEIEHRVVRRSSGEIRIIHEKCEHFRNRNGEIIRSVGMVHDITERKQAEAEITSLAKFPTENPNPVLRVQNDGKVIYANAASQELLEVWDCEINGYLPQELRDFITVAVDEHLNKSVDVLCKDKVYSIMLAPIVESGYINIYGRDITERKRAEEALKRLAEDLRRSNAELEQFAYVASHDLQEPLRMISSYVQLLGRRYQGKLDSDADEFIHFAVDGAKRMQNLINDLLSYSRVGTRSNPLVPVSAEDILKEALANLQFLIEESSAKITHGPLPVVRGDFPQLVMVFQNLVGNAIKFRGAELPCIHMEARRAAEEWIFSVRDNGIGIDPKFAERIFVIFQRLNDRTAYPGTGIGLAICKRVIQRHGGRIWVESEPGEGATFYFTLPVKETL